MNTKKEQKLIKKLKKYDQLISQIGGHIQCPCCEETFEDQPSIETLKSILAMLQHGVLLQETVEFTENDINEDLTIN